MHSLIAIALFAALPSGTVTYKCRDAEGNWTAQACLVPPPTRLETPYLRYQRERQLVERARRAVRDKLSMYCFRLDPKASVYDCVDSQMLAYDVINRLARDLGPISPDSARLAGCMTHHRDARSDVTDYRRAMECYFAR
ncbi:hypothetical protein [Tahibacter amnicola]|uniref:DUF4124 domain-containing protein n=1 Tax=Tahibacter amnicola TaxID=2976241 RepID=A0ABY6BMC6_9GAMM|nr:hypothetical protein [Tahibacter amnicola]UXI68967.1 hypothetical protein N4264_04760 [Tahibacter amnicola]